MVCYSMDATQKMKSNRLYIFQKKYISFFTKVDVKTLMSIFRKETCYPYTFLKVFLKYTFIYVHSSKVNNRFNLQDQTQQVNLKYLTLKIILKKLT